MNPMEIAEIKAEMERHHSASFGWALSCCHRDRVEAEEVLQTVYLKILEGKAKFRGDASFKTWVFAVIRKTAANEYRKDLLHKLRALVSIQQPSAGPSRAEEPDVAFDRTDAQGRFQKALEELPRRQREVLHLVFYQDLSLSEAAEVMGISIGSARQHYDRGKKHLRETLEQTEVAYGISWRRKENHSAV
jgi:RNA polymerase sigma-70 factor (ECF subfamily)